MNSTPQPCSACANMMGIATLQHVRCLCVFMSAGLLAVLTGAATLQHAPPPMSADHQAGMEPAPSARAQCCRQPQCCRHLSAADLVQQAAHAPVPAGSAAVHAVLMEPHRQCLLLADTAVSASGQQQLWYGSSCMSCGSVSRDSGLCCELQVAASLAQIQASGALAGARSICTSGCWISGCHCI